MKAVFKSFYQKCYEIFRVGKFMKEVNLEGIFFLKKNLSTKLSLFSLRTVIVYTTNPLAKNKKKNKNKRKFK